ncbi:MAG: cytidylate kinase-like family protein [Clostridiales bacterium]|nr:cytidylate kinase-like family protein [Clostridiales bacterium]
MENFVVTIARGYGSGGKTIGKMLAKELGVEYYDQDLIKLASEESGIHEGLFGQADEKVKKSFFINKKRYKNGLLSPKSKGFVSDENLFNYQAKVIKELADKGNCIIVGRCADYILKGRKNVVKVFVFADHDACVKNAMETCSITEKEAIRRIEKIDKERSSYYKYYTGNDWDNARNYDVCLDSSDLGFEKCVEIIKGYLKVKAE